MRSRKKPAGKGKLAPKPSEAAFTAACYLLAGKSTQEENRLAVRHLLRQAARSLERSR